MLAKVYVKFYLVQINSSLSYYDHLKRENDIAAIEKILDFDDTDQVFNDNNQESNEVDFKYKKFFLFKNKIFSKVEVMGLVVEAKGIGVEHKQLRYIIYLDDGSSLIQCICWNNKNPSVYNEIKAHVKSGDYILIFGYVDNYHGFEILIDNFKKVSSSKEELNFHSCLENSQNKIFSYNPFPMVIEDVADEQNNNSLNYNYKMKKKEYCNRLLAYFQNLLQVEEGSSNVFISHSFNTLFSDKEFTSLFDKFCSGNGIKEDQKEQFFIDCLILLEEQCLGSLIEKEGIKYMELKLDTSKIIGQILSLFIKKESTTKEISYIDIFNEIQAQNDGFYTGDYLIFILDLMIKSNSLALDSLRKVYYRI